VIDAGLMFPESELLGVDIVVPDITYLIENKQHVRAIILTHGHMDHIGGLPWILSEIKVPVYATEFTLAYVEGNLEENQLLDETELVEIKPREKFTIGPFTIEPIRVTHSLVDAVSLAIETPVGIVIHTGDFKIDLSPLDDKPFDLHTFAEYGKRGVLALLQDSTNVERSRLYAQRAARSFPGSTRSFRRPRRSSSSVASPPPSTASASPSIWPASMAARWPSSAAP
jgi:ribonuclease J